MKVMIGKSDERLKELILYIATKCDDSHNLGAVKLNKILFLADFTAYKSFGQPITGSEYMRLPNGPAPRRLKPVRQQMVEDGDIKVIEQDLGSPLFKPMQKIVPLRKADVSHFTADEIVLVDTIIEAAAGLTGAEPQDC